MARFGRGQPHAPIVLRNAATQVALLAVVSGVHIIGQAPAQAARRAPARQSHVLVVRPSRTSLVPDRLAPQITIVAQATERATRKAVPREAAILSRGSPVAAQVFTATPKPVVASPRRLPRRPTPLSVWILNPPTDDSDVVVTPPAFKPVVLSTADVAARRHPARSSRITQERNPAVIVPDRLPPAPLVVGTAIERPRQPVARRVAVLQAKGSPTAAPVFTATPQPHVIAPLRSRRVARDAVASVRTAAAAAAIAVGQPVRVHVVNLLDPRKRLVRASHIALVRAALEPPPYTILALFAEVLGDGPFRYAITRPDHDLPPTRYGLSREDP